MNRPPPQIFDRQRAAAKWKRARSRQQHADGATYLVDTLADDIADRLDFMQIEPVKALVIGDANERLVAHLGKQGVSVSTGQLGVFDEEQPGEEDRYGLIVHLLGLGMVNDLPGALIHARNALAEGGLFIAAFAAGGSLPVLREIALAADGERPAARMHPLVDNRSGTALLERAGFARQVVDSYPIRVRFSSLERLVADLRDHGLTASLTSPAPPITRAGWQRARAAFDALREEDGKVTESFEILVLTGWR